MTDFGEIFERVRPKVGFSSLRWVETVRESFRVDGHGVHTPVSRRSRVAVFTVIEDGGVGHASTTDLSTDGLYHASIAARDWARRSSGACGRDLTADRFPKSRGEHESVGEIAPDSWTTREVVELLRKVHASAVERRSAEIPVVDAEVECRRESEHARLWNSEGADVEQRRARVIPRVRVVVEEGERRAERTFDGEVLRPAGLELLRACLSTRLGSHLAEEAARLLAAPEVTEESADLLLGPALVSALIARTLAPSLEVPRMLDGWCGSDAATRVGSTIVGLSDIGETTLAAPALSLELDPEGARFDAEGAPYDGATPEEMSVVRDGRLVAGLGGAIARHEGVVPTLSALGGDGWEVPTVRPTLRLGPGEDSWPQLLARVESGYWVEGPAWFSFDAARDRGWVGGEWGRRIENGELGALVCRPAFRYDSATFWPALRAVGDASQRVVRGLELDEWESFEAASPTALFGDASFGLRPSSGGA